MIGDISVATNVYIVCGRTDMRKSIKGLCAIIQEQFHRELDKNSIFLFCGKRCDRIKILFRELDGYAGYNKLKQFQRCSCYAHIRRYFVEAIPKGKETNYQDPEVQGMLYCNKLFEYERSYRMKGLSYKQIQKCRLKDQKPIIEAFLSRAEIQTPIKGSRLAKAITYVLNQKPYMMTYLEDGRCSLSNQISENAIRPVTLGRKNWKH